MATRRMRGRYGSEDEDEGESESKSEEEFEISSDDDSAEADEGDDEEDEGEEEEGGGREEDVSEEGERGGGGGEARSLRPTPSDSERKSQNVADLVSKDSSKDQALPPGIEPLVLWQSEGHDEENGQCTPIEVDPSLVRYLRPHQRILNNTNAVQFQDALVWLLRALQEFSSVFLAHNSKEPSRCISLTVSEFPASRMVSSMQRYMVDLTK